MLPARRGRARTGIFTVVIAVYAAVACGPGGDRSRKPATRDGAADSAPLFIDITESAGLRGPSAARPDGTFALPEIMGAGIAVFDADGDGDLDILQPRFPLPGSADRPAPNRLFLRGPNGIYTEAPGANGLDDPGYGQGVAIGDVDDDGDPDVYFANYGADGFYENGGDGTYRAAGDEWGLGDDLWSAAATFCDYDRDGDLDLYVAHYVRYEFRGQCADAAGAQDYCAPALFDGIGDTLYRNEGGAFTDVSAAAGIRSVDERGAKGLGVLCTDLTGDDWPDFLVANDGVMNHLWVNRRDGTFAEEAIMRGVAVNRHGAPEASMGIAAGDVDGDGVLDVFITHVRQETNTLYRGEPGLLLSDRSVEAGFSADDMPFTGFGCALFDYDHDGDLDLAVVNGRVYRGEVLPGARLTDFWNRFAEPNFLFANDGRGRFETASHRAGSFASRVEVSRGLALGDLDADGDLDLVVSDNGDGIRIFRNDAPQPGNHWLVVRARVGPRDAIGARVIVHLGDRLLSRLVLRGPSYQSASDPRAHFGLGSADRIDGIEVLWPDGSLERFEVRDVDRVWTLKQGGGVRP